ncbi:hypothetical protein LTR10_007982 [Elasticomyces elasticus]|nr:hypothetical protein LTR10_007982 [Elasticomyces elasticus]KAK4970981.1 hypothetical protein LTR42_007958 [Elasticomyces elasticus]
MAKTVPELNLDASVVVKRESIEPDSRLHFDFIYLSPSSWYALLTEAKLPLFPLRATVICLNPNCRKKTDRFIVSPDNPNGNAGRAAYRCGYPPYGCGRWATWNDNVGVFDDNPLCHCGLPSREDSVGAYSGGSGDAFWRCATGSCGYRNNSWEEQPALPELKRKRSAALGSQDSGYETSEI